MPVVWIIGNGGHAKVVIEALKLQGTYEIAGIVSDDPATPPIVQGVRHVSPVNPETFQENGIARAIIGIGAKDARECIAELLDGIVEWVSAVHPAAFVSPEASIGHGVLLGAGSIVQPGATVGNHTIINSGAIVDHDSSIGAFSHVSQGVHLAGRVTVGDGTLIGVGASAVSGITIGSNATIGAGSVVTSDVPDGATVAGNPARPME
jgi:acetyltransferase EpsM